MVNMEIKFEINLRQLCIIAMADKMWNEEKILDLTKKYFCSPLPKDKPKIWKAITEKVIEQIDPKLLPKCIYKELCYVVKTMGKKRRDFFIYLKTRYIFHDTPNHLLYEHYFKTIYWTYYGIIDEERIIKSWFNNPDCDLWKVYIMACCFCSEEVIREIWNRVSLIHPPEDFQTLCRHFSTLLAAYWNRRFTNNFENFIEDMRANLGDHYYFSFLYANDDSVTLTMFKLAAFKGYKAAKYFWLELNENEKNSNIKGNVRKVLNSLCFAKAGYSYRQDKFTELLISFGYLNNNNDLNLLAFLKKEFDRVLEYMSKWPWVDLLVPCIYNMKGSLTETEYKKLFCKVVYKSQRNSVVIYQKKIYQLWRILHVDYKKSLCNQLVAWLFDIWDIDNLKVVLNDRALVEKREELIKEGYFKYNLFLSGNYKEIQEFMEVMVLKAVDKSVQLDLKVLYHHLIEGELNEAISYLENDHISELSKNILKNYVDEYVICTFFLTYQQFNLANEFLSWKFDSNESVITGYKYFLFFDDFFKNYIYNLWTTSENIEETKIESSNFLAWFSFSSQELKTRIVQLIMAENMSGERCIVDDIIYKDHVNILDDFLIWCGMNPTQIRLIKDRYNCRTYFRLLGRYTRENERSFAEIMLNGMPINEKELYLKKFLESRECLYSCKYFVGKTFSHSLMDLEPPQEEVLKELKLFINNWMKPLEDFNTFQNLFERNREIEDIDESGTDSSGGRFDKEFDEYKHYVLLGEENFHIFLDLLKSFKENNNAFAE